MRTELHNSLMKNLSYVIPKNMSLTPMHLIEGHI